MKTRAAILTGPHQPFHIMELELDPPAAFEVRLRMVAAGLCHSDLHMIDGELAVKYPVVGGHEAAGIVEEVGPGVTKVKVGDHVVCSYIPSCGHCRYCSTGHQNLCDQGATILEGTMPDGTYRFHSLDAGSGRTQYGALCMLGAFSEHIIVSELSVVKVDAWLPLDKAVLVGCGVTAGWGSAVKAGAVKPGDTTVIYGAGGLGQNAIQGAKFAGARHIVVIDPIEFKRDTALVFGATHVFADPKEAHDKVVELTWGQLADQALVIVSTVNEEVVANAFAIIGKGGTVVMTGIADPASLTIRVSGSDMVFNEKVIRGCQFGSSNPQYDIVKLLRMYDQGLLKLDELITRRYRLDEINEGYQDLRDGKNIRGIIDFSL